MAALISQVRVEQRIFWRNRSGMFFTFILPMLVLGFAAMFADRDWLVPGVAALAIISTSFQALAISLAMHRDQGVLKRLMSTPLPTSTLVTAKVLSISIVALIEVATIIVMGRVLLGTPLPESWGTLVVVCTAGVAMGCTLAFAVVAAVPSGEAAPAVTNAIYLPMMFISGIFYPLSKMPDLLAGIAQVLPLWHLAAALREAWLGAMEPASVATHIGVLAAWTLAGLLIAMRRFRWSPSLDW